MRHSYNKRNEKSQENKNKINKTKFKKQYHRERYLHTICKDDPTYTQLECPMKRNKTIEKN